MKATEKRKPGRLNMNKPSPYLKEHLLHIGALDTRVDVADLGCGNGRNSEYLKQLGYNVISFDLHGDYGVRCDIGRDNLPIPDASCDVILLNYVLMFLEPTEIKHLVSEVKRVARPQCRVMVEMYQARTGNMKDVGDLRKWNGRVKSMLGWKMVHEEDCRFIAENTGETQC